MTSNKTCIVFDTNILYVDYERNKKFKDFSFSGTFQAVINKIEELDIYENVSVGIPQIVWNEMEKQNIEAHEKACADIVDKLKKCELPFLTYNICNDIEYKSYLMDKISEYKQRLNSGLVSIIELNFPSENCYKNLIRRAYEKIAPFEGRDKSSDKGFKDALLWESIIEYKKNNIDVDIVLYTNDKMFNDELKNEYNKMFNEDILIVGSRNETILINKLSTIASEKDPTNPINKESSDEYYINKYIESEEFLNELRICITNYIGSTPYYNLSNIVKLEINNIDIIDEQDDFIKYDILCNVEYDIHFKNDNNFYDNKDILVSAIRYFNETIKLLDINILEDNNENTKDIIYEQ